MSAFNDGDRKWPPATLVMQWSLSDPGGSGPMLQSQRAIKLPSLKPRREKGVAVTVPVPVNSVADVEVTLHLESAGGVRWRPIGSPACLQRHVHGQSAENVPVDFDYEVIYRNADLEKDWWTVVGPATRAEYENLGRGKLEQLIALGLQPQSRVLDVGCGTGQLTDALVPFLSPEGLYFGTDVARPAVEFCRARFPRANFHFVKNEQTHIPIQGVEFDFIYLGSVFTHMYPIEVTVMLGELRRLMAASGCVVCDAFVSSDIVDFVGNRAMIQLNEANLLAGFASQGFEALELFSAIWNEQCRRVIYKLTATTSVLKA